MIDLHCHILPGIDDGARHFDQSLAMARIAAADGIRRIVATPHIRENLYPASFVLALTQELNRRLVEQAIPIEVIAGGDVFALLETAEIARHTIHNTPYVLIEFPYTHIPASAGDLLFQLRLQGLKPIITHPERNPSVIHNPEVLLALLGGEVYVQITADSLTGKFGREEQACAIHLLRQRAVHFIASDAHADVGRVPILSKGRQVAEKILGKQGAQRLVCDNPQAVVSGGEVLPS